MRSTGAVLIICFSLALSPNTYAWSNTSSSPFWEMMLMMMKMMSIISGGVNTYPMYTVNPMINNANMMGNSYTPALPWMQPSTPPIMPTPAIAPTANNTPSRTVVIDGTWVGSRGEHLQVANGKFSLTGESRKSLQGDVFINNYYLGFRIGQKKLLYEYALKDTRMVLRDLQGQLILFRKQQ